MLQEWGRVAADTLLQPWSKEHKNQVDRKRQEVGRPAIDYSKTEYRDKGPKVSSHLIDWVAQEKEIAESSLAEMYAEVEKMWAEGVTDPLTDSPTDP